MANTKLDHVLAVAHVANGKVHADIDSKNQYLMGLVSLDALTNSKKLEATLVADVRDVNLYSLEVTKAPMRLSLCGHMDIRSDLKDSHDIMASMSDITVRTAERITVRWVLTLMSLPAEIPRTQSSIAATSISTWMYTEAISS